MQKGKYIITGSNGNEEREGWLTETGDIKLGLYKGNEGWEVTELSTGFLVTTAKTRKEGVDWVKANIEKLKKAMEKAPKLKPEATETTETTKTIIENKAAKTTAIKPEATETKKEDVMAKKANNVTVQMKVSKVTKNTVRFEEVLKNEFAAPEIGTIYIPKATLGNLGYKDGKAITLTVEVK